MFSLVLPIALVPEGHEVRKVTGQVKYRVAKNVNIYGDGGIKFEAKDGTRIMMSESSGNIVSDTLKVAVDFDSIYALEEFIDLYLKSHQ